MGTVGINFGSATSGTGFDVASTVTSILAAQQAVQTPQKNQLSALQAQDTVFTQLGNDLSTLTTALQTLTDANGPLSEKQGSSSDTNVLSLTSASTSAVAGSHTVVVDSVATTGSGFSDSISSADTLSGSITINNHQINVLSGTSDTLATLATAINTAAVGVTASVITDANGSRLSLVSNTSGLAGAIHVTSALTDGVTAVGFTAGPAAANASLTVDGQPYASASNTVAGAIPGVTFQLLSPAAGTSVQVVVTNDNTSIETSVQSLVNAYNAVITDITGQEKNDSTGNPEPLFGSPTLTSIQTQLQAAIFGGTASGSINSISQLGISTNSDGTLSLDSSTLDTALNSSFADITGFLQNANSFGQNLSTTLNSLGTQGPHGTVYLAEQQNSTEETNLNADIAKENAALAIEQTSLTAELNAANQELQAIPSQLNQVNEIYSAISGYNQNTGA